MAAIDDSDLPAEGVVAETLSSFRKSGKIQALANTSGQPKIE